MRDVWKAYLRTKHLSTSSLLRDDVHLNEQGQRLMAEIVKGYLDPALADAKARDDGRLVEVAVPSADASGKNLRIPFRGSRVELIGNGTSMPGAHVLIDGKPPCSWPAAYQFDRTTPFPGSNWPSILRVQKGATSLVSETWTATIESSDADLQDFRFVVRGSVTGADGQGNSRERFVSTSGRIVIDPDDWNLAYAQKVIKSELPRPFIVSWQASCLATDTLTTALQSHAPNAPITLVQGLTNGKHVLELTATVAGHISGIRVYRPLVGPESTDAGN